MNPNLDYKALSRGISRDMSAQAILRRLKIASSLRDAAIRLSRATFIRKVNPVETPIQPVPTPRSIMREEDRKKTKKVVRWLPNSGLCPETRSFTAREAGRVGVVFICILGCIKVSCEGSTGFIRLLSNRPERVNGDWSIFYPASHSMILHWGILDIFPQ